MKNTSTATLVIAIIILTGALLFLNHYGFGRKLGNGNTAVPVSATTTVQGVFTCLPHRDTSGPTTMECAFGIKADNGSYYALDWGSSSTSAFDLPMGRKFSVTGLLVPIEAVSSDHWQIYDVKGIIRVASYAELASDIPTVPAGSSIVLELGKPVIVAGTTLKVTAVTQDHRCAKDVTCIWAGKVAATLDISSPSGKASMEIEPGKTVTTETLVITLDDVSPYPVSTHKIADAEYRFSFTAKAR